MNIEELAIGAPFYLIVLVVLVAALFPAAVALDRRRVILALAFGVVGIAIHGAYLFAVDRFTQGYDGMALLLAWPVAALILSAILAIIVRRTAGPHD